MNKRPEIVPILSIKYKVADDQMAKNSSTLSIKYIKYKVGGLKNLFADEQKSRNSSHASKLVPTQQEGFGQASDFFFTRRMKWNNIFQKKVIVLEWIWDQESQKP